MELNAAPATAARIAIKYTGYYRCYVDDIEVKALPNCLKPTSVTATPDGNITWEGEGSTWNLNYKASSASTWTEVNGLTSMSYTIPNLTGLTTYSVRVQNVCDDNTTTDWTTATFTTPAGIPLVELFNGTSAPTGWTRYIALLSEVMDGTATLGNATTSGWNFGTGNGVFDNHAKVNVYGLSCKYWLVTPALTMENNVQLSFDVAYTAYSGSGAPAQTGTDDKFVVLITTDGGTTWTILRQWDNAGSEYVLNNLNPSPATVTYDLSSYAGQNIAVAFYAESTSSNADNNLHIDNVSIDYIPSCQKPTDLNATNITANSAELSWVANSGETAWTLYWKESGATDYTEVANATNPYTLNGLAAATNYEFYVVANCSADDASEASATFTFATACDVIPALGFSENFDSYTAGNNVLPNCWSYINTTTSSTYAVYPRVYANSTYSTYANTAPNCLFLYSYGSDYPQPQYAILPEMTGLAGLQVTLMAKGYNASSTLKIGTMSDPTDASTFTMIAEQTLTTSYPDDPFEYLIPADCANSYLAIMIDAASGYNTRGVYVDDIVIREAPTCLKPTELAVTGVSTTTVTLGWTNGSDDQTAWQICLNGDETNLIMAESNPFTIEDLTAATSYTAKVRAYCGEDDQSDWSNEVSFTTLCEAISTFPWTENFNSLTAGIPNCWDNSEGTTTALNYMWNYFDSGHEGAGLRFNSYNNSNGLTNFLKTVSLSLPSDQLMQLSFWYKNPTGGDFSVYISTDGGATHETSLATGLTGVTTWTEHPAISLADYAGQEVVIVFKGTSNYGSGDAYIYLDDVTVMEVPSCMKPNGLEVTATTATTATLSWTAGANETAWQICLNGDETNLIMAESNPFIVEDLTASTAYTAKVRAYCNDNDQSDWSNEVSFATECEAIVVDAANPFTEDFEGDWTPLCWESIPHIDGTTTRQWTKTTSSSNIHTGAGAAYSGYYGPIYLVMPDLQLGTDGNAAQLTFWSYNTYVNDYDKNSIVLLDGENEVELWSPESVNNSWEEVTIDLTAYMGQTISLAFKYEGNNAHGWYVDD
ncbi:MAG: fibronectin type III domain-containing protein, partial [Bacteroidales bacterium]|nr:fibronectin type III domain-containing protein [Bacteroidales bacterium]